MYIYGGFWFSIAVSLPELFAGEFTQALLSYFFSEALPPTSLAQVIGQIIAGTFMAGSKWLVAMILRK